MQSGLTQDQANAGRGTEVPFDAQVMLALGLDDEGLTALLALLDRDLRQYAATLRLAAAAGDAGALARAAHVMRGAASIVAAGPVADLARLVEAAVAEGRRREALLLAPRLDAACLALVAALARWGDSLDAWSTAPTGDGCPVDVPGREASLLLVDDDEATRHLLGTWLSREGLRTDTATGGAEALRRLTSRRYQVVILDLQMPGMSGVETLGRLRQRYASTEMAVIIATGDPWAEDAGRAMAAGADACLGKPVRMEELLGVVSVQLERLGMEAELAAALNRGGQIARSASPGPSAVTAPS